MPSNEERLAVLEEHRSNTDKVIDALFGYMKEGRQWREETSKCLAVVVNNQDGMKVYQEKCENDRISYDKRITECEGFQRRQIKGVLVMMTLVSLVSSQFGKMADRLIAIFSS